MWGVNDFFVLTNGERIGETWIKFNESNSDGGVGSAYFNATGQNFQFNNIKVYVGRSERRLIWQALEQFYIDSSNVNITHSVIRFLIEGTEEVVRLHVWDTGGNLRVNNNLYNYYAFDDDTNTYWGNYWSSARPGMCIIFDKPLNITKLSFTGGTGLNDLVIRVNKQIYRSVGGYQGGDRTYTWNN